MAAVEAIARTYLEADSAAVEFTSIPATYEHLQLVATGRDDGAGSDYSELTLRLGTGGGAVDSGNNYYNSELYGINTTSAAEKSAATHRLRFTSISAPNSDAAQYGGVVINICDYANTNKNTTLSWVGGTAAAPTYPWVAFGTNMWNATGAVDRIGVAGYAYGSLLRGSEFTLYGWNSS